MCVAACCWCCVERWASESLGVADESQCYVLSEGLTRGQWHTGICLAHRRSSWSSYRKSQCATGDSFILTLQKIHGFCKGIFLVMSVAWWPCTNILTHHWLCLNENVLRYYTFNRSVAGMWSGEFKRMWRLDFCSSAWIKSNEKILSMRFIYCWA